MAASGRSRFTGGRLFFRRRMCGAEFRRKDRRRMTGVEFDDGEAAAVDGNAVAQLHFGGDGRSASKLTRRRPPFSPCSNDSIFPTCSVIPVNIVKVSLDAEIGAVAIHGDIRQRRRFWEPLRRDARHRHAAGPHDFRSIEEDHFIHNAGFECSAVEFRASFEQHVQNLAAARFAEDSVKSDVSARPERGLSRLRRDERTRFRRIERLLR